MTNNKHKIMMLTPATLATTLPTTTGVGGAEDSFDPEAVAVLDAALPVAAAVPPAIPPATPVAVDWPGEESVE
jgi:hypothetical protein